MNYIIYDLEWNQPATWDLAVTEPVYLTGEIIEIGAVKLNDAFQLIDEFKTYITPQYYKKLHNQIVSLTGIRDKDLQEKGIPFPEAYERFMAFCGEEFTFMTWSMSDLPVLIDNMILHNIDLSKLPECCDIQRIFGREIMRGETRYSLDAALGVLQEKGDVAHDALHDARNTAKVCNHLDLEQYLREYTGKVFAELPSGTLYDSKRELLADPSLQEFDCPWCGAAVKCEPWVSLSGSTYLAYGICPEKDEFLVQLSVVNRGKGECSAKRIVFELTDDLWDFYMDRKELLGV